MVEAFLLGLIVGILITCIGAICARGQAQTKEKREVLEQVVPDKNGVTCVNDVWISPAGSKFHTSFCIWTTTRKAHNSVSWLTEMGFFPI